MMGRNKLILCGSEMDRAVEYYLNNVQFKETVKVFSISEKSENGHPVFEIILNPIEPQGELGTNGQEEK